MAVRTKQLAEGTFTNSNVTIYTCPTGETTIVKYVTLFNPSASTATTVRVRLVTAGGARTFIRQEIPIQTAVRIDSWLVMEPGDTIDALATAAGINVEYTLSGAELEGVAD